MLNEPTSTQYYIQLYKIQNRGNRTRFSALPSNWNSEIVYNWEHDSKVDEGVEGI